MTTVAQATNKIAERECLHSLFILLLTAKNTSMNKTLKTLLFTSLLALSFSFAHAQESGTPNTTSQKNSPKKATYKGRKRKGKPHGYGRCTWPDGRVYEGNWEYGMISGEGTMNYANGDSYQGEWERGQKDGRGTYMWSNGDKYTGGYEDGKRQGWGVITFANGDKYEGYWKNDQASGEGRFTWANGSYYSGQWRNNQRHGQGVMVFADGGIQQGDWKNGEYVPCQCEEEPSAEQALEEADAVVAGRVIEIQQERESKSRNLIRLKVTEYWKGDLGISGILLLSAGRSSCDFVYFEGGEYLLFLKKTPSLNYTTTQCLPSGERPFKELEAQKLDALIPCQQEAVPAYFTEGVAESVCGCDGQTYSSPKKAAKNGVKRWKIGRCEE